MPPADSVQQEPQTRHTKGPWEVYEGRDGAFRFEPHILGPSHTGLARWPIARMADNGGANVKADARLIAAAPDLLAALEAIQEATHDPHIERIASAAIARATGGAS